VRGRSGGVCRGGAVGAGPENFHCVGDVCVAVFVAGSSGPAFDFWSFDFYGAAALAAYKVVVVFVAGAAAVAGFAVVAS
jgi:hypothetical protein